MALQAYPVHRVFGEDVAFGRARLDADVGEILLQEYLFHLRGHFERHLYHLRLAVRVGREVQHARARCALSEVVLAVAGHCGYVETLDVCRSVLAVAIYGIVRRAVVVALEHLHVHHVLAYEYLVGHTYYLVFSVLVEYDYVVYVGAVAHELVLFQPRTNEALLSVDVELLVRLHHFRGLDGVEAAYLGAARMVLAVFVFYEIEPPYGDVGHVGEVVVYACYLVLYLHYQLVGLVLVELQDALHLYLHELQYVVAGHLAHKILLERFQTLVHMSHGGVHVGRILEALVLVDALLDEYAFERGEEQLFEKLAAPYLEFLAQQAHGAVNRVAQHVAHGEEARLVVLYHAAVGRQVYLAVGEGIQRVDGLVGRYARRQMHLYLHLGGSVVVNLARLYLALVYGFEYGVDERCGGLAVWYLLYDDGLVVYLLNLGAHFELSAALTVVILAHVYRAAGGEVGI